MSDSLFIRWAKALMERIPRSDWPDLSGAWWAGVRELLDELRPTEPELGRLLALLQRKPPRGLDQLIPRAVEELAALRAAAPAGPTDRQRAEAASRDCPECSGCGMASREHEKPGYGRYGASYYCHRCDMGRWLKAAHLADPKGPRLADLGEHPALWGNPADATDPAMVRRFDEHRRRAQAEASRRQGRRGGPPVPAFGSTRPESAGNGPAF